MEFELHHHRVTQQRRWQSRHLCRVELTNLVIRARPTCIGANNNINHRQTRRLFVARDPDRDVGELPRESIALYLLIPQTLEPVDQTSILDDDRWHTEVGVAGFSVA